MPISLSQDMWFIYAYYDPETGEQVPTAVNRWYTDADGTFRMEMFDPLQDEWVDNPGLIAATGIGGDNNYWPTTEEAAMQMVRELRNAA